MSVRCFAEGRSAWRRMDVDVWLCFVRSLSTVLLCLCLSGMICTAFAGVSNEEGVGLVRTQIIDLQPGWNAVYIENEPLDGDPNTLFEGTPVEVAATYFRPVTPMEFIESPDQVLPDRKSWNVWYAPGRKDAVLSNLYTIQSHQGYLLYSSEPYMWQLEGVPFYGSFRWYPNAYNLVGFSIDAYAPPTLANFFAGSAAHTPLKVYRLDSGHWVLVTHPDEVLMESGVAYWIYCKGASEFRGPLQLGFSSRSSGGVAFTENTGARQLQFTNVASYPQEVNLSLQAGEAGPLPMAFVLRALNGPNQPIEEISVPFPEVLKLGPIEPGQAFAMDLEVLQDDVTVPVLSATLMISTDAGQLVEIPLVSIRRDLAEP